MINADILYDKNAGGGCFKSFNGFNELRLLLSVEPGITYTSLIDNALSLWYWDPISVLADDNIGVVKVNTIAVGRFIRMSLEGNNTPTYNTSLPSKVKHLLITTSRAFTPPTGITEIYITAIAGGGGGGCSWGAMPINPGWTSDQFSGSGGGGGAGESVYKKKMPVKAGTLLTVTIGGGGTAGYSIYTDPPYSTSVAYDGGAGGATTLLWNIGTSTTVNINLTGGGGGVAGGSINSPKGRAAGGAGGVGFPSGSWGDDYFDSKPPLCGGMGASGLFGGGGGRGRGAALGVGADGSDGAIFGAGGGGGGGVYQARGASVRTAGGKGGTGAPGVALIEWIIP